jgi:hypothetical protein
MRDVAERQWTMAGAATHPIPPHGDVVIHAPPDGWSWDYYQRAIQEFTRLRGRAPRWITMHPDTLETLSGHAEGGRPGRRPPLTVSERPATGAPAAGPGRPIASALTIATRLDHDRTTIVLG